MPASVVEPVIESVAELDLCDNPEVAVDPVADKEINVELCLNFFGFKTERQGLYILLLFFSQEV